MIRICYVTQININLRRFLRGPDEGGTANTFGSIAPCRGASARTTIQKHSSEQCRVLARRPCHAALRRLPMRPVPVPVVPAPVPVSVPAPTQGHHDISFRKRAALRSALVKKCSLKAEFCRSLSLPHLSAVPVVAKICSTRIPAGCRQPRARPSRAPRRHRRHFRRRRHLALALQPAYSPYPRPLSSLSHPSKLAARAFHPVLSHTQGRR